MKEDFIKFLNALMEAAPDVAEAAMNDNVKSYIDILQGSDLNLNKPMFTENGKIVLSFMQERASSKTNWTSKEIGNEIGLSSRTISGALRKLVNDKFVEKIGTSPVVYVLTEKGKNVIINENEGE